MTKCTLKVSFSRFEIAYMLNIFFFEQSHIRIQSTNLKVRRYKTTLSCIIVLQIDGKQTLNENIADNGGIKLAYEASNHLTWA